MLPRRVLGDGPGEEGIDAGGDFPVDYWCDVLGEVMRREASTIRPTEPTPLSAARDSTLSVRTGSDTDWFAQRVRCGHDQKPSLTPCIAPHFLSMLLKRMTG